MGNGENGTIVTTGTFDGVHRGHIAVLNRLKEYAAQYGLRPLVITFDRHPLMEIAPERVPKMITDFSERNRLLRAQGVEVDVIPFDDTLRHTSSRQWLELLHDKYNARALVLGHDNSFGNDGRDISRPDYLRMAEETGLKPVVVECLDNISSSAIRKALQQGDIETANLMLGRKYSISGIVEHGRGEGKKIGFPTANIKVDPHILLPANGVYEVEVDIPQPMTGITNIGIRPSFNDGSHLTVETHIPGLKENLYGRKISITPVRRLRDEIKFNSIEELKNRIKSDLELIRPIIVEDLESIDHDRSN